MLENRHLKLGLGLQGKAIVNYFNIMSNFVLRSFLSKRLPKSQFGGLLKGAGKALASSVGGLGILFVGSGVASVATHAVNSAMANADLELDLKYAMSSESNKLTIPKLIKMGYIEVEGTTADIDDSIRTMSLGTE